MEYSSWEKGIFLSRPNRFVARVMISGKEETVHVKNTGRCKELLVPGCEVYLARGKGENRKTEYDLIAVKKERAGKEPLIINMDSAAPNEVVWEWLKGGALFPEGTHLFREKTFGSSRFDFFAQTGNQKAFLEVKGVTLEENGKALFPDAPTLRGIKHVEELIRVKEEGMEAYLIFVIQMKEIRLFSPNDATHPAFGKALRAAKEKGVHLLAFDCRVTPSTMVLSDLVPILL